MDAKKSDTPVSITMSDLSAAFAAGMAEAMKQVAPKPPFDYAEYLARPENQDPADKLKRKTFHHGQPIQIRGCSQATLDNLDALEAGTYIDDMVTVEVRGKYPHEEVFIETPFVDRDRRLQFYQRVSSFSDLVQKIVAEQRERKAKK